MIALAIDANRFAYILEFVEGVTVVHLAKNSGRRPGRVRNYGLAIAQGFVAIVLYIFFRSVPRPPREISIFLLLS